MRHVYTSPGIAPVASYTLQAPHLFSQAHGRGIQVAGSLQSEHICFSIHGLCCKGNAHLEPPLAHVGYCG
jgi:hypothetical protein